MLLLFWEITTVLFLLEIHIVGKLFLIEDIINILTPLLETLEIPECIALVLCKDTITATKYEYNVSKPLDRVHNSGKISFESSQSVFVEYSAILLLYHICYQYVFDTPYSTESTTIYTWRKTFPPLIQWSPEFNHSRTKVFFGKPPVLFAFWLLLIWFLLWFIAFSYIQRTYVP